MPQNALTIHPAFAITNNSSPRGSHDLWLLLPTRS
jgi:hypothetical protein